MKAREGDREGIVPPCLFLKEGLDKRKEKREGPRR